MQALLERVARRVKQNSLSAEVLENEEYSKVAIVSLYLYFQWHIPYITNLRLVYLHVYVQVLTNVMVSCSNKTAVSCTCKTVANI